MGEPVFVLRGQAQDVLAEVKADGDVSLLVNWVFWNFWQRQQFPFRQLERGQTLYWVDTKLREIAVELRVTEVAPVRYETAEHPYGVLERAFGIGSEEAGGGLDRRELPVPGYLFAVAVDPVAYLGVPIELDWSKVGGRAGWAAWRTVFGSPKTSPEARAVLEGLPPEGRPPAVRSYPIDLSAVDTLVDLPRAPRMPTAAVARDLRQKSGGRCQHADCTGPAEHLDHIYPWAHGGNSEAINLQWLCAKHNLEKSDQIPDNFSPEQLWLNYVTELSQTDLTIGTQLEAHEIRTRNSTYFLVVDGNRFLLWKRGSREVFVEKYDSLDQLLAPHKDAKKILVPGSAGLSEPLFTSSRVKTVESVDPFKTLARLGRSPGDTVPLVQA